MQTLRPPAHRCAAAAIRASAVFCGLFLATSVLAEQSAATQPVTLGDRISERLGLPSTSTAPAPAGNIVTITARALPKTVSAGGSLQLEIAAKISDGWHINSHHPTLDFLIPTRLRLSLPSGVTARRIEYPASIRKKIALGDLELYEDNAVFKTILDVASSVPPGTLNVQGRLEFQPCNDASCLAPAYSEFQIAFKVARVPADTQTRDDRDTGEMVAQDSPVAPNDAVVVPEPAITPLSRPAPIESKTPWIYAAVGIAMAGFIVMILKRRS